MRRLIETAYCDVANTEHGSLVEASRTDVELSWDGEAVTLDLSDANYDLIAKAIRPYLEAGTPRNKRRPGRVGLTIDRRDTAYYERLKVWCDAEGIQYIGADGRVNFRRGVKDMFDEYERSQQGNPADS